MPFSNLKPGDFIYEISPSHPKRVARKVSSVEGGVISVEGTDVRTYNMKGEGGSDGMRIVPAPDFKEGGWLGLINKQEESMESQEMLSSIIWQVLEDITVEFLEVGIPYYEGEAKFGQLDKGKYIMINSAEHAIECSKIFGDNLPSPVKINVMITMFNKIIPGFVRGSNTFFDATGADSYVIIQMTD